MFLKFMVIDGENIAKISRGVVKRVYKVVMFRFVLIEIPIICWYTRPINCTYVFHEESKSFTKLRASPTFIRVILLVAEKQFQNILYDGLNAKLFVSCLLLYCRCIWNSCTCIYAEMNVIRTYNQFTCNNVYKKDIPPSWPLLALTRPYYHEYAWID